MKRISSRATFIHKRVLPVFWFGFIAIYLLTMLFFGNVGHGLQLVPLLIIPLLMAAFGYVLFRKLVFDLVDEVWDDADALVVKNSGAEERVALRNIINIGFSTLTNPARVTLTLREPGRFGKEIAFSPPRRFLRFARSPIIDELIERVDRARQQISASQ
jgi:hypothetical protein